MAGIFAPGKVISNENKMLKGHMEYVYIAGPSSLRDLDTSWVLVWRLCTLYD